MSSFSYSPISTRRMPLPHARPHATTTVRPTSRYQPGLRWILVLFLLLAGCDSTTMVEEDPPPPPPEEEEGTIVAGVNVDVLFAPPTDAEVNAVLAEWEARRPLTRTVTDFREEVAVTTDLAGKAASMRVVSQTVDGLRHYGAIIAPAEAVADASLPVLVICHGGAEGVDVDELLTAATAGLGEAVTQFIYVIPSFRSEPLEAAGQVYTSDGPPSPWDGDVDDTLSLLTATLENTPAANPDKIAVVGFSRGAAVALLMGLRDDRISHVVDFFGPTDFFGDLAKLVVNQALLGFTFPLPGVPYLNETYIQPLKDGTLTIDEMRLELVRRSPVYFTDALQRFQLQLHHGRKDLVVPVNESERLIEVMNGLGRTAPDFEFFLYDDGEHDPSTLPGSLDRTATFLAQLLP